MKPDIEFILSQNGIAIQESQTQQLERYVQLLLEWNKKINLISRKDEALVWTNHILLSLSFACTFDFADNMYILDIGTGGGLPGIPLSIIFPSVRFHLVDSVRKKISAVQDMVDVLRLDNTRATWIRAEDLPASPGFVPFNAVIARSVSAISDLATWSLPLLQTTSSNARQNPSGRKRPPLPSPAIISLKGGDLSGEIALAQKNHPQTAFEVMVLSFPGSELLRNQEKKFIVVRQKLF